MYWLFQQDRLKQVSNLVCAEAMLSSSQTKKRERAAAAQTVAIINETKAVEEQIAAARAALQDPLVRPIQLTDTDTDRHVGDVDGNIRIASVLQLHTHTPHTPRPLGR